MLEPERYELFTGPAYRFELERRDLFKLLGGGLLFVLFFEGEAMAQESGRTQGFRADARPAELLQLDRSKITLADYLRKKFDDLLKQEPLLQKQYNELKKGEKAVSQK